MAKITSAYASKLLKQLNEDKAFWLDKENRSRTYIASTDEEPVIPEYDYAEVAATMEEIDQKICRIKHAINLANVSSQICVGDKTMSVDTILVRMAQLNKRKAILDDMRKQDPKARVDSYGYTLSSGNSVEYKYINYDLDLVKKEYARIDSEIMEMQIALDKHNQTFEFEVEL